MSTRLRLLTRSLDRENFEAEYMRGVRLVGTDANPECISWCREHVPGCELHINDLEPPLALANGNNFDLIISLSVFTHTPLDQQTRWLREMNRVLKPNGFLLCTVVGTPHIDAHLGANGRKLIQERRRSSWVRTIQDDLSRRAPAARTSRSFNAETESLRYSAVCSAQKITFLVADHRSGKTCLCCRTPPEGKRASPL
jgi:ubiquinone/menaquinone biosynthesis C-methylase UbiE